MREMLAYRGVLSSLVSRGSPISARCVLEDELRAKVVAPIDRYLAEVRPAHERFLQWQWQQRAMQGALRGCARRGEKGRGRGGDETRRGEARRGEAGDDAAAPQHRSTHVPPLCPPALAYTRLTARPPPAALPRPRQLPP